MPVFDMLETFLVKRLMFRPSFMLRFVTRNLYVGKCWQVLAWTLNPIFTSSQL
jgi:hypothetical protein